MKTVHVVAGVVKKNNQYLCVQRGPHKYSYINEKWEFPGGKIEEGESNESALKRELSEELSLDVHSLKYLTTVDHIYPDFALKMDVYICHSESNSFTLKEHQQGKWLTPENMGNLDWAAADLPIIDSLKNDR